MKSASLASKRHLATTPRLHGLDALARRLVLKRLGALREGRIVLRDGRDRYAFGRKGGCTADITVLAPAFWSDIAFGGSVGAGESWMQGNWHSDDLVALVRVLLRNRDVLEDLDGLTAAFARGAQALYHRLNRNSRDGARRNIAAHYDVGNDFFALWLDPTLMYSCAIFEREGMTLHEAQLARLDAVCRKLELGPKDHVLEIGTGWGGFALHAVQRYGCRVTTTTISAEQHELARRRFAEAGVEDRIELLADDYRDLEGRFDKLVSLEMIEAIGWRQYDQYFRQCGRLLKPGGRLLIQAITIAESRYDEARRSVDFIQRYIFPGGCLPSLKAMTTAIARESDLIVTGVEDIGRHYATTLHCWRRNFHDRLRDIRAMGYPESFIRMWDYYFCYCEGAFLERAIQDVHLVAERPLHPA